MTGKLVTLTVNETSFSLLVTRSPRAKRMRLRMDRSKRCGVLVLTKRGSEKAGLEFAFENAPWLIKQLSQLPEIRTFHDGEHVTLFGQDLLIRLSPTARRGVWIEENVLFVSGQPEHLPRRIKDFIKEQIRLYAKEKTLEFEKNLGVLPKKITIRDTKSRWGSCNTKGHLSLSWRLAFALPEVLDYVILHEVCHLKHMNHSLYFWKTVAQLAPHYPKMEKWLKQNAAFLHSFV